ncbi:predicted protein [Chaetomium globosum CBS 148.51]|uniref:Uncharacterized protein n=1 Tax=Chaetomium globosum (strain ATCC 6205 / CBS 148.51 / DSM 1962 / NBRC 6347 / NRRL 1970) TaxID=306901 RepID=Q2HHZ1_CHAGB|nr:uncharacterized protein CHGG_00163 [Chaetomium globosum CBS 148.51]EAQ91928.1 predicted protein [Chaetomium globosum CBS 148.51]
MSARGRDEGNSRTGSVPPKGRGVTTGIAPHKISPSGWLPSLTRLSKALFDGDWRGVQEGIKVGAIGAND